jgi:peptide/nickel transport system substrate-binding protein
VPLAGSKCRRPSVQSRRRLGTAAIAAISALCIGLVLAACSGGSSSGGSSGRGGTLTVAVIDDLRSADNILVGSTTNDRAILGSTVYDPLFSTDENAQPVPALALGATPSDDAKTWTITLRQGVKFTNGKDFTAKDVKANFEAFKKPESAYAPVLETLTSIDVVDDHTVVFHLSKPNPRLTADMTETMFIADLDARKSGQLLDPAEIPVGTGPYKWESREPGTSITFSANKDYWRGQPPLGKVVFKGITDSQSATLALQNGEVDMIANNVSMQTLPSLKSDPKYKVLTVAGSNLYMAYTNFEKTRRGQYTDGDKVHQGLLYLANAHAILPGLIGDFGTLGNQPVPPWQPGNDPNLQPYPYDKAKGMQLLAEGGIPRGGDIRLLAASDKPFLCQWATLMQSNLKDLGYNATLDCQDGDVIPAAITKYDWDLLFWTNSGRATAATLYEQRWGVAPTLPQPDDTNTMRDYDVQAMIDEMTGTLDQAKYTDLGAKIADRVVTTNAALIPGYFQSVYMVAGPRVTGLDHVSPITYYGMLYNAMDRVSVSDGTGA